jgi:hypothetical protein
MGLSWTGLQVCSWADKLSRVMRIFWLALVVAAGTRAAPLPSGVQFLAGPVNGLLVQDKVLVYGDPGGHVKKVPYVLFTEARRDLAWAGVSLVARGAAAVVPERERALFENPGAFWAEYATQRFHDYSEVNTKVLREPLVVSQAVGI